MILAAFRALTFFWTATRGSRLRPWRSPYLRWRLETYSGKPAGSIQLRDFWQMAVTERRQILRFLRWTSELHTIAEERPK